MQKAGSPSSDGLQQDGNPFKDQKQITQTIWHERHALQQHGRALRDRVRSGAHTGESEVIHDDLRALFARYQAIEAWLPIKSRLPMTHS